MTEKLEPEAKRLRKLSPGELADEIGALEARHDQRRAVGSWQWPRIARNRVSRGEPPIKSSISASR
jgi:hypothetical protein